jgi:exopolysaccharide biosynthesis polyprenyl glycosylphosphotransferase
MSFRQGQLSLAFLNCMDILLLFIALAVSIVILYAPGTDLGIGEYSQDFLFTRIRPSNAVLCGSLLIAWHFSFKALGLYQSYRLRKIQDAFSDVVKGVTACAIALLVAAQLGGWKTITLATVVLFCITGIAFVSALRTIVYRTSRSFRRRGVNIKSLLVIGGGPRAQQTVRRISSRSELGYKIIGFVDSAPFGGRSTSDLRWLGSLEDLSRIIDENIVDEAIIALPIKSQYVEIKSSIDCLEEQGIEVHLVSDFFSQKLARVRSTDFFGMPLLSFASTPPFCWKVEVKRIIDLVISAALLLAGTPVLILAAIAVKLESKGPVFFVQERMGHNKRRFRMFKFRTMVQNAESLMKDIEHLNEKDGPIFKITDDPRITRVGKFLRKFSIDELPQLINVLLGDMSLVGPRPLSIRDALKLEISSQKRRFSVRPGLTCLWQISGRSNLSFQQWVDLDLQYIDTWSLKLDCQILFKTIPAVLTGHGAA